MLEAPEVAPECRNVYVETLNAINISTTSAQLLGNIVSGKDVYATFIVKPSSEPAILSCADLNLPVSGTYKAGDQFSTGLDGLDPDTIYYYRACARAGENFSSGDIKSFRTLPRPSIPCGSSYVRDGGTAGLDTYWTLGSTGGYVLVEFEAYEIPDKLEIWQGANLIVKTPGYVSDCNFATVYHNPSDGTDWRVLVFGNSDAATGWDIHISCPSDTKPTDQDYKLCTP